MIKDIVVHLTGSKEDDVRLAYALSVARLFDAHLTGLQVHSMPDLLSITDPTGSAFLREMLAESEKQAGEVEARLKAKLADFDVEHELRRLDVYPGAVGDALASEARLADLFIGTRPYRDPTGAHRVEETVLFQSGRGCLLVPPHGKAPKEFGTVVVAWKNNREAARAVAAALPFLQKAREVIVCLVEESGASEEVGLEAGADIGRYLSRHGVSAEIRKLNGWSDAGAALLNEAKQVGADMIVMGGYGHSRFREFVLGGVTRHLLTEADVPVLTSH